MTNDARIDKIKDGWRNGVNYVTGEKLNPVLGGIVSVSQDVEDKVTWVNESELGQALQILGFTYSSYRLTTASGTKTIETPKKASGAGNSFGELMSPIEEARYYQYLGRKAPQVRIPNSSYYHYREYNETIEK